jgi:predicted small integral membrane protein
MLFEVSFPKIYTRGGLVQMKLIRKRRNGYALLFAASICLAVWLGVTSMLEVVFAFGAISLISLLLLVRQSRLLYDATLIWDNRILAVPSALISMPGRQMKKDTEETVVSTFGILIGSEIYRWGLDGVHGVRLHTAHIDQERMYLTFGDAAQTMQVELLHGMTQKQAVLDAAQKLLRETGVTADITGW